MCMPTRGIRAAASTASMATLLCFCVKNKNWGHLVCSVFFLFCRCEDWYSHNFHWVGMKNVSLFLSLVNIVSTIVSPCIYTMRNVGDLVWLHSPAVPRGRSRKLHCPWKNPIESLKWSLTSHTGSSRWDRHNTELLSTMIVSNHTMDNVKVVLQLLQRQWHLQINQAWLPHQIRRWTSCCLSNPSSADISRALITNKKTSWSLWRPCCTLISHVDMWHPWGGGKGCHDLDCWHYLMTLTIWLLFHELDHCLLCS